MLYRFVLLCVVLERVDVFDVGLGDRVDLDVVVGDLRVDVLDVGVLGGVGSDVRICFWCWV